MAAVTTEENINALNLSADPIAGGAAAELASNADLTIQDGFHFAHTAGVVQTGEVAHTTFQGWSHLGSTLIANISGLLAIVAGAGVSAYLNHLVHGHHQKTLLEHYRPQIASWTGKNASEVGIDDLVSVGKRVPGLGEELDRNRHMRNLRTGATVVASALAFAAVFIAASTFLGPLGAAAASAGLFSWAGLGFVSACMGVSLAVLKVTGKGLVTLGKKLFGYDKPNVEDHVNGLDDLVKDGKTLTPELVMGVFVSASPELQKKIEKNFGDRYDALTTDQQVQAEKMFCEDLHLKERLGEHMSLEKLTDAINTGQMSARDLMFIAGREYATPAPILSPAQLPVQEARGQELQPELAAPQFAPQRANSAQITAEGWRALVRTKQAELDTVPSR